MSLSRGGQGRGRSKVAEGFRARTTPKRCMDRLRWFRWDKLRPEDDFRPQPVCEPEGTLLMHESVPHG